MTETIGAMNRGDLHGALKAVMSSASKDLTRPHLAAVLFELEPATENRPRLCRLVTTDGHRLTKLLCRVRSDWDLTGPVSELLPISGVEQLIKMLRGKKADYETPIEISRNGNTLVFTDILERSSTAIQPSDENFPPYKKVIPDPAKSSSRAAEWNRVIGFNARYMADVAKVAAFCANDKSGGVKATFFGDRDPIRIDMANPEIMAEATVVIMPMRI